MELNNTNKGGSINLLPLTFENVQKIYVLENRTFVDCITIFGTTRSKFARFLKNTGIKKDTSLKLDDYLRTIKKADFEEIYRAEGIKGLKRKFNLSNNKITYSLLDAFGISKNKQTLNCILDRIPKDEFTEFYFSHSRHEIEQKYNIPAKKFLKLVKAFGLPPKRISVEDAAKLVSKQEYFDYYVVNDHTDKETCNYFRKKYNIECFPSLLQYYKIDKLNAKKDAAIQIINNLENKKITRAELSKQLKTGYCNTCHIVNKIKANNKVKQMTGESKYEIEIADFLDSQSIKYIKQDRAALNGLELDIYIPEHSVAIEFNGDYWHSDIFKSKNYHLDKALQAKQAGIRLIQIWEHEWLDTSKREILKSIILIACKKPKTKIYARKCECKQLQNTDIKSFLNTNHLQGFISANICYGLFYKNELVQILSFTNNKYNKNLKTKNDWEIKRSCTKQNTVVVGGFNRLLKAFIADMHPDKIFSYCDFNKFIGSSYESANFKLIGNTGPNLLWLYNNHSVKIRNPKSNDTDKLNAIAKIWQAGSLKYELNLEEVH